MTTKRCILQACISGMCAFFMVTRSPRFDLLRLRDIFLLMTSGACFGIAAAALFGLLMKKIETPPTSQVPRLPS